MASNDFIGIDIAGLSELREKMAKLYPEAADAGVELANEYMLNVERLNAPLPYPGQPFTWSSEKQRRYVMAKLREQGGPPYSRTQELSRGWELIGSGVNQILVNQVPYAKYVKEEGSQIIGMKNRGWKVIQQDTREKAPQIQRKFEAGCKNAIDKLGLG